MAQDDERSNLAGDRQRFVEFRPAKTISSFWAKVASNPPVVLLFSLLPLALDWLLVTQDGKEKLFFYAYAWAIAALDSAIFLATPINETKMRGVMLGTIIAIGLVVFVYFSLRVFTIQ